MIGSYSRSEVVRRTPFNYAYSFVYVYFTFLHSFHTCNPLGGARVFHYMFCATALGCGLRACAKLLFNHLE